MSKYKFLTGLWKSVKNTAVVIGVPFAVFLLDTWTQWIPRNWISLPIVGFIAYFIKNWIENR